MVHVLSRWVVDLDLLATGRTEEAIADMKALVKQNPGNAQFHGTLASSLFVTGDAAGAAEQFRLALDAHEASGLGDRVTTAQIYSGYGMALTELGRVDDAAVQFEKALAIDRDDPEVLNNLGTIYHRTGRLLESVICFSEALEYAPDNRSVQTNLNRSMETLGRYAKRYADGLNVLRRGKEIRGTDPIILDIKARALAACPEDSLRDCAAALDAAERACAATKRRNPNYLDTLAIVHASAGRFDRAIAISKEAMGIAERHNVKVLVDEIGGRVKLYEAQRSEILAIRDPGDQRSWRSEIAAERGEPGMIDLAKIVDHMVRRTQPSGTILPPGRAVTVHTHDHEAARPSSRDTLVGRVEKDALRGLHVEAAGSDAVDPGEGRRAGRLPGKNLFVEDVCEADPIQQGLAVTARRDRGEPRSIGDDLLEEGDRRGVDLERLLDALEKVFLCARGRGLERGGVETVHDLPASFRLERGSQVRAVLLEREVEVQIGEGLLPGPEEKRFGIDHDPFDVGDNAP